MDNNDILLELKKITRLLSLSITKGDSQKQQIATLNLAGFQPKEIAELLNTTPNNVSVALVDIRKNSKTKPKNSKKQKSKK